MGTYTAVADVGETIVELLRDRMRDLIDANEIALASPGAARTDTAPRLTVFLIRTEFDPHLRNRARFGADGEHPSPGALALELHYLVTAHPSDGGTDETARALEQHRVLGRAIQALADNTVIAGSNLRASIAEDRELRIVFDSGSDGTVFDVWNTFTDVPFQPSLVCVVGPVFIETDRAPMAQRVVERRVDDHLVTEERNASE